MKITKSLGWEGAFRIHIEDGELVELTRGTTGDTAILIYSPDSKTQAIFEMMIEEREKSNEQS